MLFMCETKQVTSVGMEVIEIIFVTCLLPGSKQKNCMLQQLTIMLLYTKLVLFSIGNSQAAPVEVIAL